MSLREFAPTPRWQRERARMRREAQAVAAQLAAAAPGRYPSPTPPSTLSADVPSRPPEENDGEGERDGEGGPDALLRGTWIVCVHERRKRGGGGGGGGGAGSRELLVQWGGPDLRGPRLTWMEERRVRRIAAPEVELFDIRAANSSARARSHGVKRPRLSSDGAADGSSAGGYQRDSANLSVGKRGNSDPQLDAFGSKSFPRSLWVAVLPAKLPPDECFVVQHPDASKLNI